MQSAEKSVFKSFYKNDERYFGKHFRVTWVGDLHFSRHYTICNVMEPHIYNAYCQALKTNSPLDESVLDDSNHDYQTLTLKNYNYPMGMSSRLSSQEQRLSYVITGPVGYSMSPATHGVNIAFAGGTGILTFIDYVAKVARDCLNSSNSVNKSSIVSDTSRLVLYVSFLNEEQAIAYELCRSLHDFCIKNRL